MAQYLDSGIKLFLVSDYMAMFPYKCLRSDYIETLVKSAKQQYSDFSELHEREQQIMIAVFRAFNKA